MEGISDLMHDLKELEQRTAELKKPVGDSPCQHVQCQCWGDKFMCVDCYPIREITEEDFPERLQLERAMMQQLGEEDHSLPADSVNRGVTIGFLVAFCEFFNLYELTTVEVLRDYIIPMTKASRCRFVDLDAMKRSGVVGTAVTFLSHTWKANFGDLVAALIDGGADLNRIVWVDIFAVRQWPTTKPDLNFEEVIRSVRAVMVVCPYLEELEDLWTNYGGDLSRLPARVRAKIAFLRIWCLYELVYASTFGKVIVMKGGRCVLSETCNHTRNQQHHHPSHPLSSAAHFHSTIRFESEPGMLNKISLVVDVEKADATVPTDRQMIFDKIYAFQDAGVAGLTGLAAFNSKVRGIVIGSEMACGHPELQCALCGDLTAIATVRERAAEFVTAIAAGGYLDLLRDLLEGNPALLATHKKLGAFAVMAAAGGGHLPCLEFLVEQGADVHAVANNGNTAVIAAAGRGHLSCLQFLVAQRADVHAVAKDGMTTIMCSTVGGHLPCVQYLVEQGADVHAAAKDGRTATMYAAMGGHLPCLEYLVAQGVDVHAVTDDGGTAVILAAQGGHLSCLKCLLVHAADANSVNTAGMTAIMFVAKGGHLSCLQFLVAQGADVHAATYKNGMTAVMLAAFGGHLPCVQYLVEQGADVHVTDKYHTTAIMYAAMGGHRPCLEYLVAQGVDVHAVRDDGDTAIKVAFRFDHVSCVEYLNSIGAN